MGMNMLAYQLVNEYKKIDEVLAITLAGSGASGRKDSFSDINIYIISSEEVSVKKRREIVKKFSDETEIHNTFWGDTDEFILRNSNTQIDISYFSIEWLKEGLIDVLENYKASLGYTTCFWHNVINTTVIYDKNGEFIKLQKKYRIEYPEELKKSIIKKNYPILKDNLSSYYSQIQKAVRRGDLVSVNHRISKFLESYFDIIFAINEMPHPGEKKLISIIENKCSKKPEMFSDNIRNLLRNSNECNDNILNNIDEIVEGLRILLQEEGLIS